jgi:hypothetical protein
MQLGRFVGDWDIIDAKSLQEDGTWISSKGEMHSGWILEGTALQDVWRSVSDGIDDTGGTTIHVYDSELDVWNSVWFSPGQETIRGFVGKKRGKTIVLESKETSRKLLRWVYYDLSENSFRWRSESSTDSGKSWIITEKMTIRRQGVNRLKNKT